MKTLKSPWFQINWHASEVYNIDDPSISMCLDGIKEYFDIPHSANHIRFHVSAKKGSKYAYEYILVLGYRRYDSPFFVIKRQDGEYEETELDWDQLFPPQYKTPKYQIPIWINHFSGWGWIEYK